MIHVYVGDGKGKTTAAVGLSVRAAEYGFKVQWNAGKNRYRVKKMYIASRRH